MGLRLRNTKRLSFRAEPHWTAAYYGWNFVVMPPPPTAKIVAGHFGHLAATGPDAQLAGMPRQKPQHPHPSRTAVMPVVSQSAAHHPGPAEPSQSLGPRVHRRRLVHGPMAQMDQLVRMSIFTGQTSLQMPHNDEANGSLPAVRPNRCGVRIEPIGPG